MEMLTQITWWWDTKWTQTLIVELRHKLIDVNVSNNQL